MLILLSVTAQAQRRVEDLYNQANDNYLEGKYEEAYRYISQYLRKVRSPEAYYLKAMIQEGNGNSFGALESYTAAIKLKPEYREAYFKRGELYFEKGYYELAIDDFTFLLSTADPGNTSAIFFQLDVSGQEQVKVGSLETMKSQIYDLRGNAYKEIGHFERALKDFERSIRVDSSAERFVNRAVFLMDINRDRDAKNDLLQAIELDSTYTLAWYNLLLIDPETEIPSHVISDSSFGPLAGYRAIEAYNAGDMKKAEKLFEYAMKSNPEDPLVMINFGRHQIRLNKNSKARRLLKKAYEIAPHRIESLYLIGNAFFKDDMYEQAIAYYENYLAKDGSHPDVWYNAAVTYHQLGNKYDACRCLKSADRRGAEIEKGSGIWEVCR